MKRAMAGILLAAAAMLMPLTARADCGDEVKAIRVKLAEVKEEGRRDELLRLIEKAEKDAQAGRDKSCDAALRHARVLLR